MFLGAATLNQLSNRSRHRLDRFGGHLIRAELERILVLEFEHVGDLLKHASHFGVINGIAHAVKLTRQSVEVNRAPATFHITLIASGRSGGGEIEPLVLRRVLLAYIARSAANSSSSI